MPTSHRTSRIRRFRQSAYDAQQGRCYYCGGLMCSQASSSITTRLGLTPRQQSMLMATAEHLVARCDGGRDVQSNIVAAHALCNHRRHLMKQPPDPDRYRTRIRHRIAQGRWFDRSIATRLFDLTPS